MVTIDRNSDGIEIDGVYFSDDDFERIKTRIKRDEFGETSQLGLGDGVTLIRDGEEIQIGKPDMVPELSWSYQDWVDHADGWKIFSSATREEWLEEFSDF